jgi:hypothetical protein
MAFLFTWLYTLTIVLQVHRDIKLTNIFIGKLQRSFSSRH